MTITDLSSLTPADNVFDQPPVTPDTEPPADDTFKCDICGYQSKTQRGATRHRNSQHGKDTEGVSPTRRVQRDIGGKGAPTPEQLTKASGRLLGYGSIALSSIVVDDDPRRHLMTDTQVDDIVAVLSVQPDEAEDIMRPLCRIFAGTTLNKRAGRKIVDNMDAADSVVALILISRRWQKYFADRAAWTQQSAPAGPVVTNTAPVDRTLPRDQAPTVEQQYEYNAGVQDSRQGVIITPDMVKGN